MELLYVWIKDYKNIKEQGFNFSPKWLFHYDPATGKLDVEDRRDKVIDNFFGEHISNVTAIVGENGSGKSSLLEVLQLPLYHQAIYIYERKETKKSRFIAIKKQCILLQSFHLDRCFLDDCDIIISDKYDIRQGIHSIAINGDSVFLETISYSGNLHDNSLDVQNSTSISDGELMERIGIKENRWIGGDFESLRHFDTFEHIKFLRETSIKLPFDHNPDYLILSPRNFHRMPKYIIMQNTKQKYIEMASKESINSRGTIEVLPILFDWALFFDMANIAFIIDNISTREVFFSELLDDITSKPTGQNALHKLIKKMRGLTKLNLIIEDVLGSIEKCRVGFQALLNSKETKIGSFLTEQIYIPFNSLNDELFNNFFKNYNDTIFTHHNDGSLNFSWGKKERLSNDDFIGTYFLSSGENKIFNFYSRLYKISKKEFSSNNLVFFIDEGELGLHAKWQKDFFKRFIAFLSNIFSNFYLQVIFTSHSPFVLSDLPKENVIFLKKGGDGNCKVVDGLKDIKQTFGANIHTLISDGFFMDGLMGDFAKEKIDKVIRYLNNDLKAEVVMTDDEAGKIINMIGEPILKRHLEQQFQYKRQNREMEDLKRRIAELENEKTQAQ